MSDQITEEQLEEMIADLQEQLECTSDDTISDELIQEIKFREDQLKEIIIKNNTL